MRALFVVEHDFHRIHPGVRRVIGFHATALHDAGIDVAFAAPQDGELSLGPASTILELLAPNGTPTEPPLMPDWNSKGPVDVVDDGFVRHDSQIPDVPWDQGRATDSHWDVAVYTNPWVCRHSFDIPAATYAIGIVYDLIPNMLSAAELHFPRFVDVYEFAYFHAIGFEFFRRNTDRISCISDSTRNLLADHYASAPSPELVTQIPFRDFGTGLRTNDASDLLLVNVLDPRKNFAAVRDVVRNAASDRPLNITVVGRERIAREEVLDFLQELSETGASVRWFRSPSDADLDQIMNDAGALLFPSFFEGLGLPILEAQAKGIPAVSSNTSSCGEINLNPLLTAHPRDVDALTTAVLHALDRDPNVLRDEQLRQRQCSLLGSQPLLVPDQIQEMLTS